MRNRIIQPPYASLYNNIAINFLSPECVGLDILGRDSELPGGVWSADLLIFVPLVLTESVVVSQFFWENGTTVNGNTDVGVYSFDGQTKLGSTGSTANSGTSSIQSVDVTDFRLPANQRLWLALGCDSSTQVYVRSNAIVSLLDFIGVTQQAAGWSTGLPATITPAIPTFASLPLFGFTGASAI